MLYDHLGNYNVAFIVAGVPPLIGAGLMCLIYKVKGGADSNDDGVKNNCGNAITCSATAITTLISADVSEVQESLLTNANGRL